MRNYTLRDVVLGIIAGAVLTVLVFKLVEILGWFFA